jgi:peptidoglycan/LPS O-acetylase OafA/YrhL
LAAVCFVPVFLNSQAHNGINRALSQPLMIWIGQVSYSVYLFHIVAPRLLIRSAWRSSVFDINQFALHGILILAAIAITLLIATASYLLIELPGQRALRSIARSTPSSDRVLAKLP